MKSRPGLWMFGLTGAAGAAMITVGSYAIFTNEGHVPFQDLKAGHVRVSSSIVQDTGCGLAAPTSGPMTAFDLGKFDGQWKKGLDGSVLIENTGTLNEWVGLVNQITGSIPYKVSYTIDVYQPNPNGDTIQDDSDPDANGDVHSNCHTGSKYRGAGGEDRSKTNGNSDANDNDWDDPIQVGHQITRDAFTTSDTSPATPFELPVGDYAIVNYHFQTTEPPSDYKDATGGLTVKVDTVQYRNNGNSSAPNDWAPLLNH